MRSTLAHSELSVVHACDPGGSFAQTHALCRDENLAAELKEFLKCGYRYFALSFYTPSQAAEIVRVIREDLQPVVDAEHPVTKKVMGYVEF